MDSRLVAAAILNPRAGTSDLWAVDLTKDTTVPLTTTRGFASYPVWSPDGKRMAYGHQPPGRVDDVYMKDIVSGAIAPVIEGPKTTEHPIAWSHDQRSLLAFTDDDKGTYLSSWSLASRTLARLTGPRLVDARAFFSPDDFIGYTARESGRPGLRHHVSRAPPDLVAHHQGGQVVGWRKDGLEILVATLSGHIVAYPVTIERGFSHGDPTTLVRNLGSLAVYTTATRTTAACSFASARPRHRTRARCGCSSGGRTACASATRDDWQRSKADPLVCDGPILRSSLGLS